MCVIIIMHVCNIFYIFLLKKLLIMANLFEVEAMVPRHGNLGCCLRCGTAEWHETDNKHNLLAVAVLKSGLIVICGLKLWYSFNHTITKKYSPTEIFLYIWYIAIYTHTHQEYSSSYFKMEDTKTTT